MVPFYHQLKSRLYLPKNVVSHGIRHLALLLKTDHHFKESIILMPELKSYLSKIKVGVAGELH